MKHIFTYGYLRFLIFLSVILCSCTHVRHAVYREGSGFSAGSSGLSSVALKQTTNPVLHHEPADSQPSALIGKHDRVKRGLDLNNSQPGNSAGNRGKMLRQLKRTPAFNAISLKRKPIPGRDTMVMEPNAIWALSMAAGSLLVSPFIGFLGLLMIIAGIVLGHVSMRNIRHHKGMYKGWGLAFAAVLFGYLMLALMIIYLILWITFLNSLANSGC